VGCVDVCAVLGLENIKQAIARLEKDGVCQTYLIDSMGRHQKATVINEPGLYAISASLPILWFRNCLYCVSPVSPAGAKSRRYRV
jgi:BRO family, N-terminal domain